jgi:chromosomal replication initiator protein
MLLHILSDYWARLRRTHQVLRVHADDWARGCEIERTHEHDETPLSSTPFKSRPCADDPGPASEATVSLSSAAAWFDPQVTTALFVDDVHQLVGRPAAQLRLSAAIDDIAPASGLVFVTCRSHPAANSGLLPQLVSRLMGGLSIEIYAPGPKARAVIVQKFAEAAGWRFSDDAAAYAAGKIDGSVRELRQSLSRCLPVRPFSHQPIGTTELETRLEACRPVGVAAPEVLTMVGRHYGVTASAQKSSSRRRHVVLARSVAMYLLRKNTKLPLAKIGSLFGGRDHTTVIHACRKIEQQLAGDTELSRFVRESTTKLRLSHSARITQND